MRGLKDLPTSLIDNARSDYRKRKRQSLLVKAGWRLRVWGISLRERMETLRETFKREWKHFLLILLAFFVGGGLLIAFLLLG